MAVTPQTLLALAPDVGLRFRSGSEVVVEAGGAGVVAGPHSLAIIDMFRTPTALGVALQQLGERAVGAQDWISIASTVNELVRLGILRDPTVDGPVLNKRSDGFDAPLAHIHMLNDRVRTGRYLEAIREIVRPGDIVIDLGTGTGIFATAAARAGAAHVYAIESSRIGPVAQRVFEVNGVADRVTLVEGHSAHVTLPVRGDVLIAEIIGLDPLGERVLETTRDAVHRLLRPGACLIPGSVEVFAVPITLPDAVRDARRFTTPNVTRWQSWYGIDFSPLVSASERSVIAMAASPRRVSEWTALADAVSVFSQDLRTIDQISFTESRSFRATASGRIDAVALWFTIGLSPNVTLSTNPREPREDNSWDHRVWGLPIPLDVEAGDELEIIYRYQSDGAAVEVRRVGIQ